MKIVKFCNIASVILVLCFIVNTIIDYTRYSATLNSAPFRVWIMVNALYFILPAVIIFVVGIIIKNKKQ